MKFNQYSHQLSVNLSLCLLLMLVVQVLGTGDNNLRSENRNDTSVEQQNLNNINETTTTSTTTTTTPFQDSITAGSNSQRTSADIIINSLDDGLLVSGKSSSDRHHYEQQPAVDLVTESGKQVPVTLTQPIPAVIEELGSYHGNKPEPRNQQDEQQDPAIIDHRPSGSESQVVLQQDYVSTQQQTTTQAPYKTQAVNSVPTNIVYSSSGNNQPQNQQNTVTSWYPASQQQASHQPIVTYAQTTGTNTQPAMQAPHYSGVLMAQPSNQVITVQHPTSINSIISEHQTQNQQQQQQQQAQTANLQQVIPVNAAPASSQQSQQVVSVNGQPMILVNPNTLTGARRISISGWLKGISSMLANIFNRREHGGQLAGQSSNSVGHWIQVGPNSPHWLTTAQVVAQQGQYQQQQLQQQLTSGLQSRPGQLASAGTNRYTYIQAPVGQQQSSLPTITTVSGTPVTMTSSQQQYQSSDLQASGSSTSYATVPPPISPNPNPGNMQQQQVAIGQYAQQVNSNHVQAATSPAPMVITNPTQSTTQSNGNRSSQPTSTVQQVRFGRSSPLGASSSGLPLAHYSRYATSSD